MKKIINGFCLFLVCVSCYGQKTEKISLDIKDDWGLYQNDEGSNEIKTGVR